MAVKNVNKQLSKTPMSQLGIDVRLSNFEEVALGYSEEEAYLEAKRCVHCKNAGCVQQCPAHNDIPAFVAQTVEGNYVEAYRILRKTSAFPGICSRICAQEMQCESGCLRGRNGHEPVSIGRLERFVSDYVREQSLDVDDPDVMQDLDGVKVAIVGAGPAGIAAATGLVAHGAEVVVYEAKQRLGGIMTYGIPEFCLPSKVIDWYVDALREKGVAFKMGRRIDDVVELMRKDGFDAAFLGHGAEASRKLEVEGEKLRGVYDSADFLLRAASDPDTLSIGEKCIVIGGGNTAIDVARTATRLGCDVTVVYRRSREEMPARAEEIKHAIEEGVKYQLLAAQTRILDAGDGSVCGVECVKMELAEVGSDGRRSVRPVASSEFIIDADMVVSATGSLADTLIADATCGLDTTGRNYIAADRYVGMTSIVDMFAGGDSVTGPATVVEAMVAGKHGAKGIRRYIYRRENGQLGKGDAQ